MDRRAPLAVLVLALLVGGSGCFGGKSARRLDLPSGKVAYWAGGALWSVDTDGRERRRLTHAAHVIDLQPTWSPDGRTLAWIRQPRAQRPGLDASQLWTVGARGKNPRRLEVGQGIHDPAWSPDGRTIAYSRRGQLWLVDAGSGRARPLGVAGGCPRWSPDARRIAFCGVGGGGPESSPLMTLELALGRAGVKTLVANRRANYPGGWSPDGRSIGFSIQNGHDDVWAVAASGGKPVRLVARPGVQSIVGWLPTGQLVIGDSPPKARHTAWLLVDPVHGRTTNLWRLGLAGDPIGWFSPGHRVAPVDESVRSTGRLVSAAGARLFVECQGHGPSVVLDSGLGVPSDTWAAVQGRVASFARVCRYDRPGNGVSQPTSGKRDSAADVARLLALLRAIRLPPPYVVVGASFGGLNAQLLAYRHPSLLRGLVLVDAVDPDLDRLIERLLTPRQARERRAQLEMNAEGVRFTDLLASDAEVRRAARRLTAPLVVLRHGRPFAAGPGFPSAAVERLWSGLARRLTSISSRGRLVVARTSGHRIAETQPALVVRAIRSVLEGR